MTESTPLPIEVLITTRCRDLGLRPSDLIRRAGLKNLDKGRRRLDELCCGDLDKATVLIAGLPTALGLPPEIVDAALRETQQILDDATRAAAARREAAWRASFKPCAFLLGTETTPSQITIYGMTGGAKRWLEIPLDQLQPPVTFAAQAHSVVRSMPVVPFFGKTIGCIVNYSPDCAVRFDLKGDPVEAFDRAYSPGHVEILMAGKPIPAEAFAEIVGLVPAPVRSR
jgi:hypothetical protein